MELLNYPPPKIVVSHNNKSVIFPPKLVMFVQVVVVYPNFYFIFVGYLFLLALCVNFAE